MNEEYLRKTKSDYKAGDTAPHPNNPLYFEKDSKGAWNIKLSPVPNTYKAWEGGSEHVRIYYRSDNDVISALKDLLLKAPELKEAINKQIELLKTHEKNIPRYEYGIAILSKPTQPIAPLDQQEFHKKEQEQKRAEDLGRMSKPSQNFPWLTEVYTKDAAGRYQFDHYEDQQSGKHAGTDYLNPLPREKK